MDRMERFHLIDQMLNNQPAVTREQFLETLEVSAATFKRDLEYLRDRLSAPIIWDNSLRGYRYNADEQGNDQYQLPGLWFNTAEIQALLSMDALLENLQPGFLSSHIQPLRSRIRGLLDKGDHSTEEVAKRIRIVPSAAKTYRNENFQLITRALLTRKKMQLDYYSRTGDSVSRRDISPQRLIYYRDNWYLDSWCHLRQALRSFSIDAMQSIRILNEPAIDIDETILVEQLESGYGIFSGSDTRRAVLRFDPTIARWVSKEQWHHQQQGEYDDDGFYRLTVPYSQDTELVMDILRYGELVEVLEPPALRQTIIERVKSMGQLYADE